MRLFQGLANRPIPNFAMIAARDFFDADSLVGDGLNDGLWCQSANSGSNIGSWEKPNGSTVSTMDVDSPVNDPLQMVHQPGQVGLLRDTGIPNDQGMYVCTIPDENDLNQTLVVWAGVNSAYDGGNYKHILSQKGEYAMV